jgi:hypothetical protein
MDRVRVVVSSVLVAALAACGPTPAKVNNPLPPGGGGVQPVGTAAPLEGSDWGGTDGADRVNFYFRKGGILHYRDPQGWWEDGTWWQSGSLISFSVSDGFATYSGRIGADGATIAGDATNRKGKSWHFELKKGTPRQPAQYDLTGQMWGGTESSSWITFYFKANGVMEYESPSGGYATDGTWEVDGNWVYFKMTGDKLEYFGSIDPTTGTHMVGNAWSPENKRWNWSVDKGVNANPGGGGGGNGGGGQPGFGGARAATIEGTTWEGDNGGDAITLRFDPGGKLFAQDADGTYDGSWYQNGNSVSFDMNDRYSNYEGTLDGATLKGNAHNKAGSNWSFNLRKK